MRLSLIVSDTSTTVLSSFVGIVFSTIFYYHLMVTNGNILSLVNIGVDCHIMVLKPRYCLSSLLPLFLAFFFCIKSFQLICIHVDELDSLRKLRVYTLDFTVYLLTCDPVVRMTLGGST